MSKRRIKKNKKPTGLLFLLLILCVCLVTYTAYTSLVSTQTEPVVVVQQTEWEAEKQKAEVPSKCIALPQGLEYPYCPALSHVSDHQIRYFDHYALCYRESYEQAEWSAYCLSASQLVKNTARTDNFRVDPAIVTGSADLADYKKSGYDRGHLTPAGDMTFSTEAMSDTFYMSNMSPQVGSFNRGVWKDLESQVRVWAQRFGRIYVVSGPLLEKPASAYASIGKNEVAVPEYYYKAILVPVYEDDADRDTPDDAYRVITMGFILPNTKYDGSFWDCAVAIDEIERRAHIDVFALLDDAIEDKIEAAIDYTEWK
ncbi:MAG: DNA/RNA non-specific endonuclease [Treponema sp.]|nr:DNA/RNA non-specific endonuclease [Treponema sp.]